MTSHCGTIVHVLHTEHSVVVLVHVRYHRRPGTRCKSKIAKLRAKFEKKLNLDEIQFAFVLETHRKQEVLIL